MGSRRGRLCDLRRCTMTPIISAAPTNTTANTEKLVMAASFHTSGVSSTDLHVLHDGVLGYCLHDAHGTHMSVSEFQNSALVHWLFCALTSWKLATAAIIIPHKAHKVFEAMLSAGEKLLGVCSRIPKSSSAHQPALVAFHHGKASIRVSHPEESAPCFNSAHTHASSSTPMTHFLCTVLCSSDLLRALTGNSASMLCALSHYWPPNTELNHPCL